MKLVKETNINITDVVVFFCRPWIGQFSRVKLTIDLKTPTMDRSRWAHAACSLVVLQYRLSSYLLTILQQKKIQCHASASKCFDDGVMQTQIHSAPQQMSKLPPPPSGPEYIIFFVTMNIEVYLQLQSNYSPPSGHPTCQLE